MTKPRILHWLMVEVGFQIRSPVISIPMITDKHVTMYDTRKRKPKLDIFEDIDCI